MSDAEDRKARVRKAIEGYHKRLEPKPQRHNEKPEAVVEKEVYEELNRMGWSIDYYESKATYSADAGMYLSSQVRVGHSDLAGNTPDGYGAYIEMKAPGRRSTLRDEQRDFLLEKIATNAFAIVADSLDLVLKLHALWRESQNKKAFLLNQLPPSKKVTPLTFD